MAQLADYVTATKALGYDAISDTIVQAAVQQARRRVFQDRRWSFLDDTNSTLTTTADTDFVSFAGIADLLHIDAVWLFELTDERLPLPDYVDMQIMRELQSSNAKTGTPTKWTRRGSNIVFWPTPDRELYVRLDHVNYPGDLAALTDDIIPDQYQDLVTWAAAVPLGYRVDNFQKSAAADQYYTRVLLPRYASQDDTVQRQSPRRIRTGYWRRYR